ncbi:hypothetical protein [Aureivirga sp. CE67]|uniref:hypothetical protein n=1 Tax=Aureivirga sp. CE67 TaxID=1788983 RepID=UPI0018CB04E2|nr:hypothetical protein [Aureivirga sp. CE67]
MKTSLKITLICFLCLPLFLFAQKQEQLDIIEKTFDVEKNSTLEVSNSYGNINLNTWDQNKIYIKIVKKVKGKSKEKVEKLARKITFDFENRNNKVVAETNIGNFGNYGSGNLSMQIDYFINAPKSVITNLKNEYGNIIIDDLYNSTKIQCAYGSLVAHSLNNSINKIVLEYSDGSTIDFANEIDLNTDYSNVSIVKANYVKLLSDYSNIKMENIENLDFNIDYGNLSIDQVKNAKGNSEYTNLEIGEMQNVLNVVLSYGSIKVKDISTDFSDINLRTAYAGVKLQFPEDISFNFDLFTEYGSISELNKMLIRENFQENTSHKLKGVYNEQKNKKNLPKIKVTSSYNSIRLQTK